MRHAAYFPFFYLKKITSLYLSVEMFSTAVLGVLSSFLSAFSSPRPRLEILLTGNFKIPYCIDSLTQQLFTWYEQLLSNNQLGQPL